MSGSYIGDAIAAAFGAGERNRTRETLGCIVPIIVILVLWGAVGYIIGSKVFGDAEGPKPEPDAVEVTQQAIKDSAELLIGAAAEKARVEAGAGIELETVNIEETVYSLLPMEQRKTLEESWDRYDVELRCVDGSVIHKVINIEFAAGAPKELLNKLMTPLTCAEIVQTLKESNLHLVYYRDRTERR